MQPRHHHHHHRPTSRCKSHMLHHQKQLRHHCQPEGREYPVFAPAWLYARVILLDILIGILAYSSLASNQHPAAFLLGVQSASERHLAVNW